MTINYGKRKPGGLTAADPGDTLYIPFATFNDSGAQIGIGGTLATTDIEIFKNGGAVPRATDSGYSLISDTGQYGDNVGLHRFSIQLFNTTDDTGFYDTGSQYHVAIASITVDARTVSFFPAVFEIGTKGVDVIKVVGDTGAARHTAQMADEYDTGRLPAEATATTDTGAIHAAVWQVPSGTATRTLTNLDTGNLIHLAQMSDEYDTGRLPAEATATLDTGGIHAAVWQVPSGTATRTLTNLDTGNLIHLAQMSDEYDTGRLAADATATLDTGAVNQAVWQADASRTLSSFAYDTGIADTVWKSSGSAYTDTGSLGNMIDAMDTGVKGHIDSLSTKVDTGVPASITDTGLRQYIDRTDTGLRDYMDNVDTGVHSVISQLSSKLDTGTVVANVDLLDGDTGAADRFGKWSENLTDSGTFDTGIGVVQADIRLVNATTITGTGDTGTSDTWRPA